MDTIKLIDQDPSITLLYEPRILELENKQIMHNKQSNFNNSKQSGFLTQLEEPLFTSSTMNIQVCV